MGFKYSYNTIVYTGEDYAIQSARVAKFGYDAIELVGEPDWYDFKEVNKICLLYTSPSPRDMRRSRMPSSA